MKILTKEEAYWVHGTKRSLHSKRREKMQEMRQQAKSHRALCIEVMVLNFIIGAIRNPFWIFGRERT